MLKLLWTEEKAAFAVYSYPKPLQQPYPSIIIGAGHHNTDNTRVLQRVAEIGGC